MAAAHRIRRQVLEVHFADEADGRRLRTELARIQRRSLVPVIDRCFDALGLREPVLRLDRLEVDLGSVDPDHLGRDLVAALEQRLPAVAGQALAASSTPSGRGQASPRRRTASGNESFDSVSDIEQGATSSRAASGQEPRLLPSRALSDDALDVEEGLASSRADSDSDIGKRLADSRAFEDRITPPRPLPDSRGAGTAAADPAPWSRDPASCLELLDAFLATGRVPWWAETADARLVHRAFDRLISANPARLAPWLLGTLEDRNRRRRWLITLDEPRLGQLLDVLALPRLRQEVEERIRALPLPSPRSRAGPGGRAASPRQLRRALWHAALSTALAVSPVDAGRLPSRPTAAAGLAERNWLSIFERVFDAASPDPAVPEPGSPDPAFPEPDPRQLPRRRAPETRPSRSSDSEPPLPVVAAAARADTAPPAAGSQPSQAVRPPAASSPGTTGQGLRPEAGPARDQGPVQAPSETLYPTHAGLVLLWPFLDLFFENLGWLHEGSFPRPEDRHRAAGWLRFLATGEREPVEYQLPLEKLLCGLGADTVFDFGPPVSDAEAEQGERLLTAAIAQAPILRSMPIDGFRGSFLHRLGALELGQASSLLRVKRQSWDVVLEFFPWSWTWVRLPFMSTVLRVEW